MLILSKLNRIPDRIYYLMSFTGAKDSTELELRPLKSKRVSPLLPFRG